uniref:Reverse transcriptase n=1 Tax=Chenopodium quinoa TaxID=63459 RepID=A0A803MBK5_CHEQI
MTFGIGASVKKHVSMSINWQDLKDNLEEQQQDESLTTTSNLGAEINFRKQLEDEASLRWWYWRQRAKSKWDSLGDQPTSFFYKSVKQRTLRDEVRVIQDDQGNWINSKQDIKANFLNHFKLVKKVLDQFCLLSREVINEKKSAILFSPNTPSCFVRLMRKPIHVKSCTELGTYLGCPMDVDGRASSKFNSILEKVALYRCPRYITSKLNSLINKFWWCKASNSNGVCWRKKEVLFLHKSEGGLGLKEVLAINKSLLMKQCWRFYTNPSLLARKIFKEKYGKDPISLGLMGKKIIRGSWAAKSLVRAASSFKDNVGRRIGNGK